MRAARFNLASMPRRTALVVAVPEAEAAVGALRLEHDSSAARGVPAHITILFPFAQPGSLDEAAVAEVVAAHEAFDFELASVARFDGAVTYLAPVPAEPFRALTGALVRRWPEHQPYGGEHDIDTLVPHLTVAETHIDVSLELPIAAHAGEVLLLEEVEPDGRWRERARFPLRQAGVA
jgi:2'-5' RNA ligase